MKVEEIRLYHLSAQLPEVIGNAKVFFDRRETLLVEVVAGSLSGWGETWSAPAAAATIIRTQLGKLVIGQKPGHFTRIWHDMRQSFEMRTGIAMMAVAALDMALHDLAARQQQAPLSDLLGGARRDRVPAYASGPFFKPEGHPYRDFEREVEGYLRQGFKSVKLRSGYHPKDDAAIALTVRNIIGKDAALMVDFNQSVTPRTAVATVRMMQEAKPLWIEEPALPGDVQGYRTVAGQIAPALAGGETFGSAAEFMPFLTDGSMDFLQPDIAICGGLSGVKQVLTLAEIHNRPVVPHVWGSIVNFQAALHLNAALPANRAGAPMDFPYQEFDVGPNPLLDLAGRPEVNSDGTVSVPEGPGFGVRIDARAVEPFVIDYVRLS